MNHKEQAKALVEKFLPLVGTGIKQGDVELFKDDLEKLQVKKRLGRFNNLLNLRKQHEAKQCAIIAVDFALSIGVSPMDTKYLQQVRKDIEQL